jgi:hypothetical protein
VQARGRSPGRPTGRSEIVRGGADHHRARTELRKQRFERGHRVGGTAEYGNQPVTVHAGE